MRSELLRRDNQSEKQKARYVRYVPCGLYRGSIWEDVESVALDGVVTELLVLVQEVAEAAHVW